MYIAPDLDVPNSSRKTKNDGTDMLGRTSHNSKSATKLLLTTVSFAMSASTAVAVSCCYARTYVLSFCSLTFYVPGDASVRTPQDDHEVLQADSLGKQNSSMPTVSP